MSHRSAHIYSFVFIFHLYNHVNFTWSQKKMKFHDSICSVAGVESDKVISCLWPYRVVFPSRKEVNHPPQLFLHSRTAAPSPSVPLLLRLVPVPSHSSSAGPILTFTGLLVSSQLIARITHALVAAQSVHAALLAPTVIWPGTLIHLCWGGR